MIVLVNFVVNDNLIYCFEKKMAGTMIGLNELAGTMLFTSEKSLYLINTAHVSYLNAW